MSIDRSCFYNIGILRMESIGLSEKLRSLNENTNDSFFNSAL